MNASAGSDGIHPHLGELLRLRQDARRLLLASHRSGVAVRSGLRLSRRHGRGIDFQESRDYLPGDDIRHIDWRVTARTGQPHTKLFSEERDRPVTLLLDGNPSMFFGTRIAFKSVLATRLAALFGWLATLRGDRIGALLFSHDQQQTVPATGGRRGILRLLQALLAWYQPRQPQVMMTSGGLQPALERLYHDCQPGGLLILISDFYALDPALTIPLASLRRQLDMLACQILDPLEKTPPPPGCYPISDGRHSQLFDTRQALQRRRYQDHIRQRQQQLEQLLHRQAIPLLTLTASDDWVHVLRRNLGATLRR